MIKMKILVIGASGLVGEQAYLAAKRLNMEVYGTSFKQNINGMYALDITKKEDVLNLIKKINPECIIHAAALTFVDYCETHKQEAWLANVEGTRNIVAAAEDAKVVYISSDYVFDGVNGPYAEDDLPNPINYYGLTKLMGESAVSSLENHMIVRSTWVFDLLSDTKNFIYRLINTLKEGKEIKVPADQIANPTLARSLASCMLKLVKKYFSGIINISGSSRLSRYDFAAKVAENFSLDKDLIVRVSSEELGQPAKRPKNAGFKLQKLENELGEKMDSLEESLEKLSKVYRSKFG